MEQRGVEKGTQVVTVIYNVYLHVSVSNSPNSSSFFSFLLICHYIICYVKYITYEGQRCIH